MFKRNATDKLKIRRPELDSGSAFTLAEVLITLGIIGVVAAMTIPTLMNSTQDKEFASGLKKTYSAISQATLSMTNDNGGSVWDNTVADSTQLSLNMKDAYKQYTRSSKDGTLTDLGINGWYGYKSPTIILDSGGNTNRYGLLLSDGTILRFYSAQNCTSASAVAGSTTCGDIVIDVNGLKKPNMFGRDVFDLVILKDSAGNYNILPSGPDSSGYTCVAGGTDLTTSYGCTESVLNGQKLP